VTGSLQFNQIFIRPNAEKGLAADTSLIVYPSGELVLSDSTYSDSSQIIIEKGAAVSFLEGSKIDFENSASKKGVFNIKEGASLIDMNTAADFEIKTEHSFIGGTKYLYSPSITGMNGASFGQNKTLGTWNEDNASWSPMLDTDVLTKGKGYILKYVANNDTSFQGVVNTGTFDMAIALTDVDDFEHEGWNLIGNPYPSAIDLEKIVLSSDINKSFYIYNPIEKNFKIYQKGGIKLNGAEQFVLPNEAFFIKADASSTLSFNNSARVHFYANPSSKELNNILKLKVNNVTYSDETAILFNDNALNTFDSEYDAVKHIISPVETPILYTKINSDNTPFAINTFKYEGGTTRTIPLSFEAGTDGAYTISVNELIFDAAVSVSLKDKTLDVTQDLKTNPTYNFNYTSGDAADRFEIVFSGFVGVEDIVLKSNIKVFSNNNNIFINSDSNNTKVEIYNLNGQLLLQKNFSNSGMNTISTNLPQSIYLIKVITNEETICTKVVLSK